MATHRVIDLWSPQAQVIDGKEKEKDGKEKDTKTIMVYEHEKSEHFYLTFIRDGQEGNWRGKAHF